MTEKLYYIDSHMTEFTARVLECREEKERFTVVLDRTAFYPEGGGQGADRGSLGGVRVLDVHEKAGQVLHYTDAPLTPGETVDGKIDWARRFDLTQQHSGEHIVSGLIHECYGLENVGFHMGEQVVAIDVSGELSLEQLREIEYEANRRVWANEPVEIAFYRGAELDELSYRSKKALTGDVRIVTFPGADVCACCGTHVKRTGEIGCIRLLNVQKLRGGVRVEMVCGERAYRYFDAVANENHAVSVALSVPEERTSGALERLFEENRRLKMRAANLENRLFTSMAEDAAGSQLVFEPELSPDGIARLCGALMERTGELCAVFSGSDSGGYKYAVGKQGGDVRALVRELNAALNGRGGGKPPFAQGSAAAAEDEIRAFFNEIFSRVTE
ncbi:MAG: alanyl-tRNA editing protein [Candidatus Heteroscillospira sp.]|jgi:alanyl-tRNA synthetase